MSISDRGSVPGLRRPLEASPSWPPLTAALRDPGSPVRLFLERRYPASREIQRRYLGGAGPLLVPGTSAAPATIGTAFDWMVRFMVHPGPGLDLAAAGAMHIRGLRRPLMDLAVRLIPRGTAPADRVFAGPVAGSTLDPELVACGCWALALLTELYRAGLMPGSPLAMLDLENVTVDQLLGLAGDDAVAELTALADTALGTAAADIGPLRHMVDRTDLRRVAAHECRR
jgi:hypothetical protein